LTQKEIEILVKNSFNNAVDACDNKAERPNKYNNILVPERNPKDLNLTKNKGVRNWFNEAPRRFRGKL